MMRDQGVTRTLKRVRGVLAGGTPTGYSAAGTVVAVGADVEGFQLGDRVACAGAGIANHAEIIDVPVNLAVKVPDGLGAHLAATVTLGGIAMQGVRRAAPTLGESFLVVGLGILGQLTAQLLQASGCRVIGVDPDHDRIRLAQENGMHEGIDPAAENYVARVALLTDGFGADAAIVTAARADHEVIRQAMQACRKKGRVVLVGDVGLNLQRADLYAKELDFLISTSYGPGRYDPVYELEGADYPLPYVRWTENRNMEAYLRLLAEGRISLANLQSDPFDIAQAAQAYDALQFPGQRPLLVLLRYPPRAEALERTVVLRRASPRPGRIRVALVGAGGFAQGVHLPNLVKLRSRFELRCVMSRTGATARSVATQYEAAYATTEYEQILRDPDVDLVLICTPHDVHASMTVSALEAGKHVLVEKPLALREEDLVAIERFYIGRPAEGAPVLMTGFNRRFAPALLRAAEVLANRTSPLVVNYRMNAGYLPLEHWVHGPHGGGRNLGEACHIYDLFLFLTGAQVRGLHAAAIAPKSRQWARNDNFVVTLSFDDGSVCTLTYTALGHRDHPKESMEVFADGRVISLNDYRSLTVTGSRRGQWSARTPDKGHLRELEALSSCLAQAGPWPIPLEQQLQATRISLQVEAQL
jgi:predicted dehydrogenase/threonine dehydrogenase-like Zn-dependent dehydrogenase